jgi:hypothetical protein
MYDARIPDKWQKVSVNHDYINCPGYIIKKKIIF